MELLLAGFAGRLLAYLLITLHIITSVFLSIEGYLAWLKARKHEVSVAIIFSALAQISAFLLLLFAISVYLGFFSIIYLTYVFFMLVVLGIAGIFLYHFHNAREAVPPYLMVGPIITLAGSLIGILYIFGYLLVGAGWTLSGYGWRKSILYYAEVIPKIKPPRCPTWPSFIRTGLECFKNRSIRNCVVILGAIGFYLSYYWTSLSLMAVYVYLIWKATKPRPIPRRFDWQRKDTLVFLCVYITGVVAWVLEGAVFTLLGMLTMEQYILGNALSILVGSVLVILRALKRVHMIEAFLIGTLGLIVYNPLAFILAWIVYILAFFKMSDFSLITWKFILKDYFIEHEELYYDLKQRYEHNLASVLRYKESKNLYNFLFTFADLGFNVKVIMKSGEVLLTDIKSNEFNIYDFDHALIYLPSIQEIMSRKSIERCAIARPRDVRKVFGVDEVIFDILIARGTKNLLNVNGVYVLLSDDEIKYITEEKPTLQMLARRWNVPEGIVEKILESLEKEQEKASAN